MAAADLHFLLVPLVAQGHIIPMVDVARLLAGRGARVTLVTTPVNAARNRAVVEGARRDGLAVELAEIAFPGQEFGLPEGVENMDQLVDLTMYLGFFKAVWKMEAALEAYLRALPRRPDCLVADACNPWTAPVCDRLAIPRLVLHCPSVYFLLAVHCLAKHGVYDRVADQLEPFEVPGFPVRAVANMATFRGFFQWPGAEKLERDVVEGEATADGLLLNTFRDVEGVFVDAYAAALGRRTWAIGPTCAARLDDADASASRGNRADVDAARIVSWLDARPPASVLYVSFGSLAHLRAKQVIELARGLEASGRPFVEQLLVDVLRVGVRSGVTVPSAFLPAEAEGVQVTSAGVVKAVTELMDGGEEGTARRERAKEFAAKARAAMEEGGSSHADLTDMIGYVSELSAKKRQERDAGETAQQAPPSPAELGDTSGHKIEADAALSIQS
uniref:Glycosyltransferase N-terminal domain-containing protein n=1 Tax=Oryza punctata TaxID=4537 RepID=A0A0E0M605_ORYPU